MTHTSEISLASTAFGTEAPLVELRGVSRVFGSKPSVFDRILDSVGAGPAPAQVHAVDGVDLSIRKGEVLGLVGESGCGKSTLGRLIASILAPSTGEIHWKGRPLSTLSPAERKVARLRTQMVFQNPFASLNPRLPVSELVGEAPRLHGLIDGPVEAYIDAQLERAGLDPSLKDRYPHEFSGGQRQRIGIARALAVQPDFLICDESVAALDVSIQAQIINLFMDLRESLELTYLFISHDLGVVEHISDRVAIMYLGRIVEQAPVDEIFIRANHPYTQALLREIPVIDTKKRQFSALEGELPSPLNPPKGCPFHPRCPHATARCKAELPTLREVAPDHLSACHLNEVGA